MPFGADWFIDSQGIEELVVIEGLTHKLNRAQPLMYVDL